MASSVWRSARAGQGLSGARAHFEPSRVAINLTKMSGSGSLAHEWWHAFDDYIGRLKSPELQEMKELGSGGRVRVDGRQAYESLAPRGKPQGALPDGVARAFKELVETIEHKAVTEKTNLEPSRKFVAAAREDLESRIKGIRNHLEETLTYGKRNVKPADA
jgi:hypothetical protein